MNMAAKKIFFSYSRVDGFAFARRLAVDLKQKGFDVWIDQEDIKAGLQWDTEIEKALESCDCVLFLETEKSVASNHVLDEVYYALEQNKKVIPLVYVDSKTPFRLKRLQHIDFTKDYATGLDLLVNELNGNTPAVTYPTNAEKPATIQNKPVFTKNSPVIVMIACVAVLIAAVIALTARDKNGVSVETKGAVVTTDTLSANTAVVTKVPNISALNIPEEEKKSAEKPIPKENRTKIQGKKVPPHSKNMNTGQAEPITTETKTDVGILNENVAGDWRLTDIEPNAQSHRGYLKIEASGEDKVTVKSYMQFYYPESKASSYLTIFNAFANCSSCAVNKEMKLRVEDIAIASRTIKKLQEDQPDGRKAGEVILDASANKSIGGTATLQFIDNNNAVIKVKQPTTVALANELMLEPFVYTFRFRKKD
jgi:hypothetical protein